MKKLIFLSLIFLSFYTQSYSQAIDIKSDTVIYQYLIKAIGKDNPNVNDNIAIFYKTSLKTLKISNFKNAPSTYWMLSSNRMLKSPFIEGMKDFLDKIDINNLSDHELTVKLGKHPFKNKYQTYTEVVWHPEPFLTFSPVIYSTDKQMAICSVDQYFGLDDTSEGIYLLMFKNGKWEVVRILGVGMS